MTYTRTWNKLLPAGARPGAEFDDAQRELRVDLKERLTDIIASAGGDIANDPALSTETYFTDLHWSAFSFFNDGKYFGILTTTNIFTALSNYGISTQAGTYTSPHVFTTQLLLTPGSTLVDVELIGHINIASREITGTVYVMDTTVATSPTRTTLATRTLTDPTTQGAYSLSSGANINHAMDADGTMSVFVEVTFNTALATDWGFNGVRIKTTKSPFRRI